MVDVFDETVDDSRNGVLVAVSRGMGWRWEPVGPETDVPVLQDCDNFFGWLSVFEACTPLDHSDQPPVTLSSFGGEGGLVLFELNSQHRFQSEM